MMKKFGFALIVFALVFAVPVTVYTIVSGSSDLDNRDQAADSENSETEEINLSVPQIVSVPSTEVLVGDLYSYQVKAIDEDGDTLQYQVVKYPSWMTWDPEMRVLEGFPRDTDVGVHRVEMVITDGKWRQTHAFDVVVVSEATELETVAPSTGGTAGGRTNAVENIGPEEQAPVTGEEIVADMPTPVSQPEDYGFVPIDQVDAQPAQGTVLGEATTLPNTASFTGVIGVSLGLAIVAAGAFLWADVRWNISEKFVTRIQYERGHQVGMDTGKGVVVKKRKMRL
jgi:hypothetical protein